jgi:hypothetical protein
LNFDPQIAARKAAQQGSLSVATTKAIDPASFKQETAQRGRHRQALDQKIVGK